MIKIRYRDPRELAPGLYAAAERHSRGTTVYLLPGLSAAQRRAALRRLRISARRGCGPQLPAPQLAVALLADRIRTAAGRAGAVFRSHPAASTVPVMVVSAGRSPSWRCRRCPSGSSSRLGAPARRRSRASPRPVSRRARGRRETGRVRGTGGPGPPAGPAAASPARLRAGPGRRRRPGTGPARAGDRQREPPCLARDGQQRDQRGRWQPLAPSPHRAPAEPAAAAPARRHRPRARPARGVQRRARGLPLASSAAPQPAAAAGPGRSLT